MIDYISDRKSVMVRAMAFRCAILFIIQVFILLFCVPALAANATGNSPVRVGFFPFEGYYAVDASGERSGYGYELLQLIAQHANLSYT